jgi:hypothetical protein
MTCRKASIAKFTSKAFLYSFAAVGVGVPLRAIAFVGLALIGF